MIIELHAIHSFAPSNLNRDDTGNPKEALFGGVRRARISSQSAKRAMRVSDVFKDAVDVPIADRTKHLITHLIQQLENEGVTPEWAKQHAADVISRATPAAGSKKLYAKADDKLQTDVAIYISQSEIHEIVSELVATFQRDESPDLKAWSTWGKAFIRKTKNRTSAPDIALFGRMLAENPELNIDAACQVAHAISTHEVNTAEFDYFTAVGDLPRDYESGALMLGLVPFNSATYYRCARIDWEQLEKNLGGDADLARQTVGAFMRAFALVVPSGMKNSFVNQHAPDFLLAVARPDNDGQSLANAFEKPVRNGKDSGYAEPSIAVLCQYWERVEACFRLSQPTIAALNPRGCDLAADELAGATVANLREWVEVMAAALGGT